MMMFTVTSMNDHLILCVAFFNSKRGISFSKYIILTKNKAIFVYTLSKD